MMLYRLWNYALVLVTPQAVQLKPNWCWAACAYIMARYKYHNSRTHEEIGYYIDGDGNNSHTTSEQALAADYGLYYTYSHTVDSVLTSNTLMSTIADYHPASIGHHVVILGESVTGHSLACIGYVRNTDTSNPDNSLVFMYDVADGSYHWFTYDGMKNGTACDYGHYVSYFFNYTYGTESQYRNTIY